MQDDATPMSFRCPHCGGTLRATEKDVEQPLECKWCGGELAVPEPGEAPEPLDAPTVQDAPSARPRRGRHVRGRRSAPVAEPASWASTRALILGILLLVAILLPALYQTEEFARNRAPIAETHANWIWDDLDRARTSEVLAILAIVGLGVMGIVAALRMRGLPFGVTLFTCATFAFLVGSPMHLPEGLLGRGRVSLAAISFMLLCTPFIAGGNHARKHSPQSSAPRVIAGVGGVLLVLSFLLPTAGNEPFIGLVFADASWERMPLVTICFVALLAYGGVASASFRRGEARGLSLTLSVLARAIMAVLPIALLLTFTDRMEHLDFGVVFMNLLKEILIVYSVLALLALGLSAWMTATIREGESREA